ncbi:MAG TPA: dihydrodipicolinate synthase family protein [Verrucomicrobiae bacterium]|nr:dihydrodipicolinate synthase family protein [Verrucomicrobiae bacterium]
MKSELKYRGVVVPMVTPVTATGDLDEPAVDRLVDFLLAGGVDGIFVVGTTGEGASIPRPVRRRLVDRTVARVRRRTVVYAGIGDGQPDEIAAGNDYLGAGVDAIVVRPPISFSQERLLSWFEQVLGALRGPVILYNIPSTTHVSIPLDVIARLSENPKLVGVKDSENNAARHEELLRRFSGRESFSVLIGVGALMGPGLKMGADGIVPSAGNLIPDVCRRVCEGARRGDWAGMDRYCDRMSEVTALYQKGRTLGESLAALKAAMACRGLCAPDVLPPLRTLSKAEVESIRSEMARLHLLDETP